MTLSEEFGERRMWSLGEQAATHTQCAQEHMDGSHRLRSTMWVERIDSWFVPQGKNIFQCRPTTKRTGGDNSELLQWFLKVPSPNLAYAPSTFCSSISPLFFGFETVWSHTIGRTRILTTKETTSCQIARSELNDDAIGWYRNAKSSLTSKLSVCRAD